MGSREHPQPGQGVAALVEKWYFSAMRTTIDAAGRIVIPKRFRDELCLSGGSEVEIVMRNGLVEISAPAGDLIWNVRNGISFPEIPEGEGLTDEQIREAIEAIRR